MTHQQLRVWLFDRVLACTQGDTPFAAKDGKKLKRFRECETLGWVTCYDSMFNIDYFSVTPKGRRAILDGVPADRSAPR